MAHHCEFKSRLIEDNGKLYAVVRAYWKERALDVYKECLEDKKIYFKENLRFTNMGGWLVSFPMERERGYMRYYNDRVPDYEWQEARWQFDGIRYARTDDYQDVDSQIELILKNHDEYKYLLNKIQRNDLYNMNILFLFDTIHNWEEHPESEYLYQNGFFKLATNKSLYRLGKTKKREILNVIRQMPNDYTNAWYQLKDIREFKNTGLTVAEYKQFKDFTRGYYRAKDVSVEDWRYCVKKGIDIFYYADLCQLVISAGVDPDDDYWKYPSNPIEAHDRLQQMIQKKEEAKDQAKYTVLEKICKRNLKTPVELEDGYQIFIPTNYMQFKACADLLNQCLLAADYVGKMAKGKSLIVMIWKDGRPSSTAEISYDNKVLQFYGDEHNRSSCKPKEEEYQILDSFMATFKPKKIRQYLGA